MKIEHCRECNAEIVFLRNQASGKVVPVDAATVKPGDEFFVPKSAHVSHFTTCTNPARFSKQKLEPAKLTDQSRMPFGKFAGHAMEEVPADYLLWLWDEVLWKMRINFAPESGPAPFSQRYVDDRARVHDYIREKFNALETECPDRIVAHRPE